MSKLHICFLQYNLQGGGAERKVCTLANYFASQGHTVEIGLFGVNQVAYQLDARVKISFLRRNRFEYKSETEESLYQIKSRCLGALHALLNTVSKKAALKYQKHFEKKYDYTLPIQRFILNRPDAVFITMMVSSYLEILRVMDQYWSKGIPVPYLVMDCSDPKKNADQEIDRKRTESYPKASRVLVMTQEAKQYFIEEIQRKCVVIPNPVRDNLPKPYQGERRKVIVNFCRLNRQKNLPMLLEAFAVFHQNHPEYKLEQYGQGEQKEELEQLIRALGLEDIAVICPFNPNVHSKICDCAMFVSSSDWEGFPNSVLEALAIGLPTISTDCDFGPRDMIHDHENGLLIPVGDVKALAAAMAELAENPELADRLSKEAIKVREIYDVDRIGKQWLDLIEEVAKERGLA